MTLIYHIYPELTHMNAPNAWAVWREGDNRGPELIAHGIPLKEALEQIEMDAEQ